MIFYQQNSHSAISFSNSTMETVPFQTIRHQQHTSYSCHIFGTLMVHRNRLDKHLYPVLLHKYFELGEGSTPDQLSLISFQNFLSTNQNF